MRGEGGEDTSRFGKLFPDCPPYEIHSKYLLALSATMLEPEDSDALTIGPENLPAGYTYLGQFLDHDITFDAASLSQRRADPSARFNFRSPFLDLDSLYGRGVVDQPYLYDLKSGSRGMFLTDKDTPSQGEWDLPRNQAGVGVIADPRNDANLILSQLHLAFMQYHNKVFEDLAASGVAADERYEATCQVVRNHYQWMIAEDYLSRIIAPEVLSSVLVEAPFRGGEETWRVDLKHFPLDQVFMPMEFSAAAFRFGHSMVRSMYFPNREGRTPGLPIFDRLQPDNDDANDFRGFRKRPLGMRIDWSGFFRMTDASPQLARPIDTLIAHPLVFLPTKVAGQSQHRALPFLNLTRGVERKLPCGQDVAQALGVTTGVIGKDLAFRINQSGFSGSPSNVAGTGVSLDELQQKFREKLPLWYYVLKEAELVGEGSRLGPIGSRIVAEVVLGLLLADKSSIFQEQKAFRPRAGHFGCIHDNSFSVVDLLRYAV